MTPVLRLALLAAGSVRRLSGERRCRDFHQADAEHDLLCWRVYADSGGKPVLNISDLDGMLASGDTTVKSTSLNPDIEIDDKLSWSSTHQLTLDSLSRHCLHTSRSSCLRQAP
ncbi:MAG: hypothetical protein WDM89_20515 [Rhizomicrobium sp.]